MEDKLKMLEDFNRRLIMCINYIIDNFHQLTKEMVIQYRDTFIKEHIIITPEVITEYKNMLTEEYINNLMGDYSYPQSRISITKIIPSEKKREIRKFAEVLEPKSEEIFDTEMISIDIPTETQVESISTDDLIDIAITEMMGGKEQLSEEIYDDTLEEPMPVKKKVIKKKKKEVKKVPKKIIPKKVVSKETREERLRRKFNASYASKVIDIGKELNIKPAKNTKKLSKAHVADYVIAHPKLHRKAWSLLTESKIE